MASVPMWPPAAGRNRGSATATQDTKVARGPAIGAGLHIVTQAVHPFAQIVTAPIAVVAQRRDRKRVRYPQPFPCIRFLAGAGSGVCHQPVVECRFPRAGSNLGAGHLLSHATPRFGLAACSAPLGLNRVQEILYGPVFSRRVSWRTAGAGRLAWWARRPGALMMKSSRLA